MEKQIVLIEIEGGMVISLRSTQGIVVAVHDRDTEGNDEGEKTRKKNEKASKKLKKALPIAYGESPNYALEVLESSPTPTDWAVEATRIGEMQDSAKQYMIEAAREGVYVSDYYVLDSSTMEKVEVRFVKTRDDLTLELFDAEVEIIYSSLMTPSDWVELAGIVQKAIAGGNNQ